MGIVWVPVVPENPTEIGTFPQVAGKDKQFLSISTTYMEDGLPG